MEIRKIQEQDIINVFYISKQQFGFDTWKLNQYQECLKQDNYVMLGIFEGQKLLSFIVANESPDDVNILMVATDENFKRKKLAGLLVNTIVTYAKSNKKTCSLEVRKHNLIAINLYKKFGFKIESERKGYYSNGDDALIMFYRSV